MVCADKLCFAVPERRKRHTCPCILVRHVVFGFSADELSVVPLVFVYMLNVCKFFIWGAHNDFRFWGVCPSAVDVMGRVESRVFFYLPLFFRRFWSDRHRHYFARQWGACGVVASVQNDALVVHILSSHFVLRLRAPAVFSGVNQGLGVG